MPHDPVVTKQRLVEKSGPGGNDRLVLTKHEAPSTVDGGYDEDLLREYDEWAAQRVMEELERLYPGHHFRIIHDSFNKICLISIPILMGVNRFMAVNLRTHALDSDRVKKAGGEILERYKLARGRFELDPFLDAREKHSALVLPSRPVPE